jgi:hypothetical protein
MKQDEQEQFDDNTSHWHKLVAWLKSNIRKLFGSRNMDFANDATNLLRNQENNSLNLQEKNIKADETDRKNKAKRHHDVERQTNSSRVADDTARRLEINRDRGDIRVFEKGLADECDGDSGNSERVRREAESERLVNIAKHHGLYLSKADIEKLGERRRTPTGESVVYIDKVADRIYKVKDPYAKLPMKRCVQPEDAIYEHLVHNILFPEIRYKFEGVSDVDGDVRIVLSQKYVESTVQPTKAQIEASLAQRGLMPEGKFVYGNEYVIVTDVVGDNALLGQDGKVYFIDPIIGLKRPIADVINALS